MSAHLLLIEDNIDSGELLKLVLEEARYQVCWAETGAGALKMAAHENFDLILLDLTLPDVCGEELGLTLKMTAPYVPIIVLSAKAPHTVAEAGRAMGAVGWLRKPFELKGLLHTIAGILGETPIAAH